MSWSVFLMFGLVGEDGPIILLYGNQGQLQHLYTPATQDMQ